MGSLWRGGVDTRLSSCRKCDLNLIYGPRDVVSSVSARLSSSWRCCGRGGRVQPFLSRSISPRKLLWCAVERKGIRASHQENVLPFREERRGDNGVLSFDGAVLEGAALGLEASFAGEDDPRSRLKEKPSLKKDEKEAGRRTQLLEELIERAIFNCRFFTIMAVCGSLAGSLLCFIKGSCFIVDSFREYFVSQLAGINSGKVILLLVEAVDVYLMGTVMLIFGMGVYELFISSLEIAGEKCEGQPAACCGSNLFGLFRLRERPKWLEIRSLDELKTKLGHVIVMILLVGMFEKSKKVPVNSGVDLLCFAASILLASGCLFLLSKLHKNGPY